MSSSALEKRSKVFRQLQQTAAVHARDLGRELATDDLLLLALTEAGEGQPARRALAREGVDAEGVLEALQTRPGRPSEPTSTITFSPEHHLMAGRAEGLAAALGDGTISAEHVLLALIWNPTSASSVIIRRLGASRQGLVEHLAGFGVAVPSAPLPPYVPIEWGPRVWFERSEVDDVIRYLHRHIPPDARWGFNYRDERAFAIAEASIDLGALVTAARAEAAGRRI